MKTAIEQSDTHFLNELHRIGGGTVQELSSTIGVTATAIRQRLVRLQLGGFIKRELVRTPRGRPRYVYRITEVGLRQIGDNYGDLALILWREIRNISDPGVRQELTNRVREALVARLGKLGEGRIEQRLRQLSQSLSDRGYDVEVDAAGPLPILRENNCPYQELAEEDRDICELEQEVFEKSLGAEVRLTQCCRDGHNCCEFEVVERHSQSAS
jgi:predicted ArsR family transcriptional regulator